MIRRNDRCTAILREVRTFRVNQGRYARIPTHRDHGRNVAQCTFAIIGQYDSPGTIDALLQRTCQRAARHCQYGFLIQSDELLTTTLDTRLGDRRAVFHTMECADDPSSVQDFLQRFRRRVLAHDTDQLSAYAQTREIYGDIGRTTRPLLRFVNMNYRHRSLWRDPAG